MASSVLPLLCDSELYITTLIEILQGRISTTSALCGSDTAAVIRSLADNRASLLRTAHARLHSINKLASIKYSELDALEDAAGDAARACDASASLHASALASLALSVHSTVSLLETCNSLNPSSMCVGRSFIMWSWQWSAFRANDYECAQPIIRMSVVLCSMIKCVDSLLYADSWVCLPPPRPPVLLSPPLRNCCARHHTQARPCARRACGR